MHRRCKFLDQDRPLRGGLGQPTKESADGNDDIKRNGSRPKDYGPFTK